MRRAIIGILALACLIGSAAPVDGQFFRRRSADYWIRHALSGVCNCSMCQRLRAQYGSRPPGPSQLLTAREPRRPAPQVQQAASPGFQMPSWYETDPQFGPTPHEVVAWMVHVADLRPSDVVCDPGCGDGRVCIAAVRAGAERAIGYEINTKVAELARKKVAAAGLSDRIEIWNVDSRLVKFDYITVHLCFLHGLLDELAPEMSKHSRKIVSYAHDIPALQCDEVTRGDESLFVYTRS